MKKIKKAGFLIFCAVLAAHAAPAGASLLSGDFYSLPLAAEDAEGMEAWDGEGAGMDEYYMPPVENYPAYEPGRGDGTDTFPPPGWGVVTMPWFMQRFQTDI